MKRRNFLKALGVGAIIAPAVVEAAVSSKPKINHTPEIDLGSFDGDVTLRKWSGGIELGGDYKIYLNENGVSGTELFVHGTCENSVNNYDDAKILARKLRKVL